MTECPQCSGLGCPLCKDRGELPEPTAQDYIDYLLDLQTERQLQRFMDNDK